MAFDVYDWKDLFITIRIFLQSTNVNITKNKYKILISALKGPIIQMKKHMIEWSTKNGEW